jgi:hypothetical protein
MQHATHVIRVQLLSASEQESAAWDIWATPLHVKQGYAMAGYQEWEIRIEDPGSMYQPAPIATEAIIPLVRICTGMPKGMAEFIVRPVITVPTYGGRPNSGPTTCSLQNYSILQRPSATAAYVIRGS